MSGFAAIRWLAIGPCLALALVGLYVLGGVFFGWPLPPTYDERHPREESDA